MNSFVRVTPYSRGYNIRIVRAPVFALWTILATAVAFPVSVNAQHDEQSRCTNGIWIGASRPFGEVTSSLLLKYERQLTDSQNWSAAHVTSVDERPTSVGPLVPEASCVVLRRAEAFELKPRQTLWIDAWQDGRVVATRRVSVSVTADADIAIATASIAPGEAITSSNTRRAFVFEQNPQDLLPYDRGIATNVAAVSHIREGQIIHLRDSTEMMWRQRGSVVPVRIKNGDITIETRGVLIAPAKFVSSKVRLARAGAAQGFLAC